MREPTAGEGSCVADLAGDHARHQRGHRALGVDWADWVGGRLDSIAFVWCNV